MRVGLVCPYSFDVPGGVQSHVLGLARWLTEQGHQAYLLGPGQVPREAWTQYGLDSGRMTSTGRSLPVRYNGSVARVCLGPRAGHRVRRWLQRQALDLVHVHEPLAPSVSLHAVWSATSPVVATFHTATSRSRSLAVAARLLPGTLARISAPVAVSPAAAEVVARHLGMAAPVVGNGIRVADFSPVQPSGRWRGGDRPRLTFVGRLGEPRKGLAVLLQALPAVLAAHPDLDVVLAGAGRRPPAPPQARFVGPVSDAERNALLATSDVFVAPHTGRESFGIVILEALAAGAQVVASDLPAFSDVLRDEAGMVGRVARAGDPGSLAEAVVASLRGGGDPARGRRLAARYDWSVIGPALLGHYQSALAADPSRAATLREPLASTSRLAPGSRL
ncbi:MAG: glycosyltransferase family 4 protein [Actinomycetia bacterium]|nr:glycosyltransferase family 4 protein [Actinomycetes bacterium]